MHVSVCACVCVFVCVCVCVCGRVCFKKIEERLVTGVVFARLDSYSKTQLVNSRGVAPTLLRSPHRTHG